MFFCGRAWWARGVCVLLRLRSEVILGSLAREFVLTCVSYTGERPWDCKEAPQQEIETELEKGRDLEGNETCVVNVAYTVIAYDYGFTLQCADEMLGQ